MFSSYVIGFGIGWCLAYILALFFFSAKSKTATPASTGTGGEKVKTDMNQLFTKIDDIKKQFGDNRMEQIKSLSAAYARNPKAFKYDYDNLIKEPETKVKVLDDQMKDLIQKCNTVLDQYNKNIKSEMGGGGGAEAASGPSKLINYIGIAGIIIANLLYFVIKL